MKRRQSQCGGKHNMFLQSTIWDHGTERRRGSYAILRIKDRYRSNNRRKVCVCCGGADFVCVVVVVVALGDGVLGVFFFSEYDTTNPSLSKKIVRDKLVLNP